MSGLALHPGRLIAANDSRSSLLTQQEVDEFINHLTRIATTYRDSQQLRCRLSHVVLDTLTSHNLKA